MALEQEDWTEPVTNRVVQASALRAVNVEATWGRPLLAQCTSWVVFPFFTDIREIVSCVQMNLTYFHLGSFSQGENIGHYSCSASHTSTQKVAKKVLVILSLIPVTPFALAFIQRTTVHLFGLGDGSLTNLFLLKYGDEIGLNMLIKI